MNILKLSLLNILLLMLLLSSCNSHDDELSPGIKGEQYPVKVDFDEIFQFYTSSLNPKINNRVASTDIPGYEDLVYEFAVSREIDSNGSYREVDKFYFTYKELVNTGTLILNLEPDVRHYLELTARYMLTAEETQKAQSAGLIVEAVEVWNSVNARNPADTLVTILKKYQEIPSFSFGKHHLSWMFGLSTDSMIPNPNDTATFSLDIPYLSGPSLYTIEVDNSDNIELKGDILLEFDGGNSDVFSINVDAIPDDLFVVTDWLSKLELVYVAPSGIKTTIVQKEEGLGSNDLTYVLLQVDVPKVYTDAAGEFISAPHGSTQYWNVIFADKLYDSDTLHFGK